MSSNTTMNDDVWIMQSDSIFAFIISSEIHKTQINNDIWY